MYIQSIIITIILYPHNIQRARAARSGPRLGALGPGAAQGPNIYIYIYIYIYICICIMCIYIYIYV